MDKKTVGKISPSFEMHVELGKVREFWRATSLDGTGGPLFDSEYVPPTFLVTQELWRDARADPYAMSELDVERSLHAEQEFTFFGAPPRVGDRLVGSTTIEQIYEKSGRRGGDMTFMVAVTSFRNELGKVVAESRLTVAELGGDAR